MNPRIVWLDKVPLEVEIKDGQLTRVVLRDDLEGSNILPWISQHTADRIIWNFDEAGEEGQ